MKKILSFILISLLAFAQVARAQQSAGDKLAAVGLSSQAAKVLVEVFGSTVLSDGTAAAPAVAFASDPDTGIYRSSANVLGLATNGLARWTIDASGNQNQDATNGGNLVFNKVNSAIRGGYDGSAVNSMVQIWGGNAGAVAQGAIIQVGSAASTNKSVRLIPATGGTIQIANTSDALTWSFNQGALESDATNGGSLVFNKAGTGLNVKGGANARIGAATLVGGTVTVSTTAVTANSRIFLTRTTSGGTPGDLRVSTKTAGTSFVITSASGTDTSTVDWFIVNEI